MSNPSQLQANKMHRVLSGKKLKYTIVFYMKNGDSFEVQSDGPPALKYNEDLRECMWNGGKYGSHPVCMASDVNFVHHEENEV